MMLASRSSRKHSSLSDDYRITPELHCDETCCSSLCEDCLYSPPTCDDRSHFSVHRSMSNESYGCCQPSVYSNIYSEQPETSVCSTCSSCSNEDSSPETEYIEHPYTRSSRYLRSSRTKSSSYSRSSPIKMTRSPERSRYKRLSPDKSSRYSGSIHDQSSRYIRSIADKSSKQSRQSPIRSSKYHRPSPRRSPYRSSRHSRSSPEKYNRSPTRGPSFECDSCYTGFSKSVHSHRGESRKPLREKNRNETNRHVESKLKSLCEEHRLLLASEYEEIEEMSDSYQSKLIREYLKQFSDKESRRDSKRWSRREQHDRGKNEHRGRVIRNSAVDPSLAYGQHGTSYSIGLQSSYHNQDIIHHMVSQTKAQKKQIRTLENEVEHLRGCSKLSQSEVKQRDVEWSPADKLGEGSFSTVYKGAFCGINVAIKELKLKLSQDDKSYFISEAVLLQQLHHPHVVLMMGVCTTGPKPFMLLEYMEGGSLHALIHNESDCLDHATYFSIAKDIGLGMNYLHKHKPQVLHLDLKSMNVLLDSYSRAKIADFGFSVLRKSTYSAQKGSIRGTPAWMAPELLTKGEISSKCDVYSYGIILWEMLSFEQPFKGYDVLEILSSVEYGTRPPLPRLNVSRELKVLISSCWAQNPAHRPNFSYILEELDDASLPRAWRALLKKAKLPTSLPQDLPKARKVIDAMQESVHTLERKKQSRVSIRKNKDKSLAGRENVRRSSKDPHVIQNSPSEMRSGRNSEMVNGKQSHSRSRMTQDLDIGRSIVLRKKRESSRGSPRSFSCDRYSCSVVFNGDNSSITDRDQERQSQPSNKPSNDQSKSSYGSSSNDSKTDKHEKRFRNGSDHDVKLSTSKSPQRFTDKMVIADAVKRRSLEERLPSKRKSPERNMLPGLALTADQLMSQKMKLRPVHPTALTDITDLPETSLQDLTVLLKQAMEKRRDAMPVSMASSDQVSEWQ